jgi:hypothetical protein
LRASSALPAEGGFPEAVILENGLVDREMSVEAAS